MLFFSSVLRAVSIGDICVAMFQLELSYLRNSFILFIKVTFYDSRLYTLSYIIAFHGFMICNISPRWYLKPVFIGTNVYLLVSQYSN